LHIFTGDEKEAKEVIDVVRKVHKEMGEAGWPWPGGEVYGFQTEPNDSFYLVVVE
jgi:hypothetical protein